MTGSHHAVQAAQLRLQAFAQVLRCHAGRFAVQQLLADRFHAVGVDVELGAGQQLQLAQWRLQVAGVIAVVQPEGSNGQPAVVHVQRQALQHAQLRIGRFTGGDARHAIVVAVLPAGAGHVPHRGFRQLVKRGRLQRGGAGLSGLGGGGFGLCALQQRVGVQQALDFLFQVQAIELQQPDRLQQLRGEVKLLAQLGRECSLHRGSPAPLPGALWNASCF
ncbi:hypothetical protein G6F31_015485 [Rhizopus arrhizus]|nr:hypothetical protein G6F31_015485 [Rhizopus arrhizus]